MSDAVVSAPSAPVPAAPPQAPTEPSMNMTGAEAKAWYEAQKGKKPADPKKDIGMADAKAEPKKEAQSSSEAVKEAIAEAKRKLKIDDQEVDEDEVIKVYKERTGHHKAASKIMQEATRTKKQVEELLSAMKDPEKVFDVIQKLGHDPRTLAEKRLAAALEEELMDPKERENKQLKMKLEQIEQEKKRQLEEQENAEMERLKNHYAKEYSDKFVAALEKTGLGASDPFHVQKNIARMANYIARAAAAKFEMSPEEAAHLVKEDIAKETKLTIKGLSGAQLVEFFGEEAANEIRKYDTSRIKSPEQYLKTPDVQPEQTRSRRREATKPMSHREWREFNRR